MVHKTFVVRILLVGLLVLGFAIPTITTEAADGAPDGFRLPFRGYAQISAGPRCYCAASSCPKHGGGIDLEAIDFVVYSSGAAVLASEAGWARAFPYAGPAGNMVKIYHPNGLTSIYAHLRDFQGIGTNAFYWVSKGQRIGTVGATGTVTGTHLHFAVVVTDGQTPVRIYNIPGITWWERNPATQWCVVNGRNEGSAIGP